MNRKVESRRSVREFFRYDLNRTPYIPWASGIYVVAAAVGVLIGYYLSPVVGVVAALIGVGGGFFLVERSKEKQQEAWKSEFARLAQQTREVQGDDAVRAFLRIFERAQLDRNRLRALDNRHSFEKERELFQAETLGERLGDLFNKSIRLWSRADFNNKLIRKVRWANGVEETFYNPLRIISLFLSESELVVCDAEIDSVDGDLREKIFRLMLTDIVSIGFTSERVRFPVNRQEIERMAQDLGYDKEESARMVRALSHEFDGAGQSSAAYVYEEMTSKLEVTRTDGGTLHFPIKSEILFGRHVSALDQDVALTEDEVAVDRMLNELNRVVRGSRHSQA
jgi:hypothetical protein